MTEKEITAQLEKIVFAKDFPYLSNKLAESWSGAGLGIEIVDPILEFMEKNPSIEFGMPGGLVHFVEGFFEKGYEEKLIKSLTRKPTPMTVWMLNRILNGTKEPEAKKRLIDFMKDTRLHPLADDKTKLLVDRFLKRFSSYQ